jgi:uncharacterized protein YifE (UPF0438 family)
LAQYSVRDRYASELYQGYEGGDPEEWRSILPLQFKLRDILMGKSIFQLKHLTTAVRGYRDPESHVTEILRCIVANPIAMPTPWRGHPPDTNNMNIETRRQYNDRIAKLRRLPLPKREPSEWEEVHLANVADDRVRQSEHEKQWETFTERQEKRTTCDEEYVSDNNRDLSDDYNQKWYIPMEPQDYMHLST